MSITRDNFYFDYEGFLQERLTSDDLGTLAREEDAWVEQAREGMSAAQFSAAMAQWANWLANSPSYRVLAYNDSFGGVQEDIPEILTYAVGWSPGDGSQSMRELFALANDAVQNGSSAPATGNPNGNSSGGSKSPLAGVGLLLAATAAAYLLLAKRR